MPAFQQWNNIGQDNFSPSFLGEPSGTMRNCPHQIAKAIPQSGVMHFAGQWNPWNFQTWYYDKAPAYPNGPGIPHHPARGEPEKAFVKIYKEYVEWIDDLIINPRVWDKVKTIIDKIDYMPNKNQAHTQGGQFPAIDNSGKLLMPTVAVTPGRSYKICLAYNSDTGCLNSRCSMLHRCRHEKCRLARHPRHPDPCPRCDDSDYHSDACWNWCVQSMKPIKCGSGIF